jgi:hypothetical protein
LVHTIKYPFRGQRIWHNLFHIYLFFSLFIAFLSTCWTSYFIWSLHNRWWCSINIYNRRLFI